jgi:hypothetical protein
MVCSSTDNSIGTCSNAPVDMSMEPVGDMSRAPVKRDLGSEESGLEGGGLSCSMGHAAGAGRGAGVLLMMMLIGLGLWRVRRARR